MSPVSIVICAVIAYLFGSIPSAVWIGRFFFGIDVRQQGSGNAGATNTFRVLGKKAGIPVLVIDILKGYWATLLVCFTPYEVQADGYMNLKIMFGLLALVGHVFPVFAGFKGGKGVATLVGVIFGLNPMVGLMLVVIFLVVYLSTSIVSVSSMVAAIGFPFVVIFGVQRAPLGLIVFSIVIAFLVIYTHRTNIKRLMEGKEPKTPLKHKKISKK